MVLFVCLMSHRDNKMCMCVIEKWHEIHLNEMYLVFEVASNMCYARSHNIILFDKIHRYHTCLHTQMNVGNLYTHRIMHYRFDQSTMIYICIVLKLIIAFVMVHALDSNDRKHVCFLFVIIIIVVAIL